MLRVRLLGGLALESGGGPIDVPASRPARELLAWLALHPGPAPRFELAQRFWPDVPEASARASLRTTLHELRRALGDAATHLEVDRERVALRDVWVDLRELPPDALLERGEPLAGIDRDWAIAARDEHRERIADALARLADEAPPTERVRWARELVRHDPLSESAARRLMRALAQDGDRAAAMAEYVRLEQRLERELSVGPSRETRRLLAELRAEGAARWSGPRVAGSAAPPSGPLAAREATGAAPPDARLPPVIAAGGPLAGRDRELGRLLAATRGATLLAGEPGIGKTRLLAEALRILQQRGASVRYGRCYEEQVAPYEPFAEALGPGAFAALVDAAGGERWRLFEAVGAALGGSVLLLDDLHWADAGSLRLLTHALRRPDAPVVLGAYRDSEVGRAHPLAIALSDLRHDGLLERVPVGGLDEAAVGALVRARRGPAELTPALRRRTGGNPFYVEEILRALAAAPARPDTPLPLPEGVKDVIGRRLARLAPETGRVLAVAAVAGREFDLALIETVLRADALGAVEEAAAAQMVREEPGRPGRYAFAHALVRETLYEELSQTRRARTHAALADALRTLPGGTAAEIAHHRLAAGGGAEEALTAAAAAMRALAYEEAASLCERGLAALGAGEGSRRAELLLALGEARLRAGEPARETFAEAAALARALDDRGATAGGGLLARAALGFSGLGVTIIAVDGEAVALLEEALEITPDDHPLRARLVARLAIETYYASTPERRKALGDEAVALARDRDGAALLDALDARHAALWSAQYLDERLATAREMLALAHRHDDAEHELQARNWLVCDLMERGDLPAARAEIDAHERLADRLRLPAYTWWAPMWRSTLAILEGRYADAEALIERFAGIDHPNARLYAEIQTFGSRWTGGDFTGVGSEPLERETGRPAEYAYRAGYSWILAERGEADAAREHIAWLAEDGYARLGDDMNRLAALAELAQAMWALQDPTHARGALERLAPFADRNVTNARGATGYGSATYHVALLEHLLGHDARPRFEAAIERNTALGARPWVERARAALARC